MKNNPYLPPQSRPQTFLRDLPKKERKEMILAGNTTAGPLAILMYKHPISFTIGSIIAVGAWLWACWTCVQM